MCESGVCFMLAYLLGSLSPAALISAIKNKNLRNSGTGNLGATNVALSLGKVYGFLVMSFDVAKAYISVKIAKLLFPHIAVVGLVAGCGAVVGHVFPFYMHFHGGKGLAAFGGMMLAFDPLLFIILLSIGLAMVIITDYPIALTFSAVPLAPIVAAIQGKSPVSVYIILCVSALVLFKHRENIGRIREGEEMKLSEYLHRKDNIRTDS